MLEFLKASFSHFEKEDYCVQLRRLLDEDYAISAFLRTMDANDLGSKNF